MPTIRLPNNWRPRDYQLNLWRYLENGGKRAAACWHRRAGKDDVCLHWGAVAAMQRVGVYWHMLPQADQARKAIWDAVNPETGKRRIDEAFPREIRESTRETDMFIRFRNGASWQVVGSDNFNSLVGSPPIGVVFSEWSLADPQAWAYMRPILLENNGWALFIFTPRGRNHAHATLQTARKESSWFGEVLTVDQTKRFTRDQLDAEKRELVDQYGQEFGEAAFQQEYFCSFDAAIVGAYYARLVSTAEAEKRITSVPWEPGVVVHTAWDLGIGDSTAIWFCQLVGREVRLIDYYEASGVGLDHYAKVLKEKPYVFGEHILPHDAEAKEMGTGKTRTETLRSLGIRGKVLPVQSVDDGINAVRMLLPRCWFDATKCARGLEALRQYRTDYDDKLKTFRPRPLHDWTSHACLVGQTEVLTRYGTRQIMNLPETGEVLTSCGWKRYINPHRTRINAPLVEVRFTDGHTVRCTPDHFFKTASGWEYAGHLTPNTEIQSGWTRSRSTLAAASTACGRASGISLAAASRSIAMLGERLSVKFRRVVTSITATMTRPTICLATSNACPPPSISATLGTRTATSTERAGSLSPLELAPLSGTRQTLGGCGTVATPNALRAGPNGSASKSLARIVASCSRRWSARVATPKSSALSSARPLRIESVVSLSETADVYCLTVPDVGEFALANGGLVRNSDAFRYLALGMPSDAKPKPLKYQAKGIM